MFLNTCILVLVMLVGMLQILISKQEYKWGINIKFKEMDLGKCKEMDLDNSVY